MHAENGQVSLWSSFDNLLSDAEKYFQEQDFDRAMELWREYASITGMPKWLKTVEEIRNLIREFSPSTQPEILFDRWLVLRTRLLRHEISIYSFELSERLYADLFLNSKQTVSYDLATGIFCFVAGRNENAIANLKEVILEKPDNLLARFYLSRCFYKAGEEETGLGYLTQTLFLGGNELFVEDIDVLRLRNLYSRLRALHGKGEVGVWLAPFEAWYRNWLKWQEDEPFFNIMQMKERNERILQVKYYTAEKYRHFIRCLYIAEYVRLFMKREKGIIWEQEAYMEKLDSSLFQRYRKKRRPIS